MEDWLVNFIKAKAELTREFTLEDVHLDVRKMNDYFKSKKMKNHQVPGLRTLTNWAAGIMKVE
jgi:hypothetical protein